MITPSLNQGRYIVECVRSVVFQRYPDLEFIVMDGGSKDDTLDRLEPYLPFIAKMETGPDEGQADAVARGFTMSTGEIMAYLNSDDILAPDVFHSVAEFFSRNPDVDFVYSHRCAMNSQSVVIYYWILPPHWSYLMTRWDLIPQETCFWRRSLWERAGNIESAFQFAMDYDLFVRFMREGRVRRLNRFHGAFRVHDDSKTSQKLNTVGADEVRKVWSKYAIPSRWFHPYLYRLLQAWVASASARFVNSRIRLAGALPGTGYHYDEVWGRVLTDEGIPVVDKNVDLR